MAWYSQSAERKALLTKNTQYSAQLLRIEEKCFPDKQKLKEFIITKMALQEILKKRVFALSWKEEAPISRYRFREQISSYQRGRGLGSEQKGWRGQLYDNIR